MGTAMPVEGLIGLASLLLALGVFAAGWQMARAAGADRSDRLLPEPERRRRLQLRESSGSYRWLEPLVDLLAGWNARAWPARLAPVQRYLELVGPAAWRAEEWLALRQLESVPTLFIGLALGWWLFDMSWGVLLGLALLAGTPEVLLWGLRRRALRYRALVRTRLPYVVDLMALMLEAGATSLTCLRKAAEENAGHPMGAELGRVANTVDQGQARAEALVAMADRLDDEDVREVVFAINTAEDRGTPLEAALRNMAEQMRLRRVQRMEKAAEEAKVHITWPAMVVMVACLIIVVAPLVLAAIAGAN
jgi:Flp pilus assembly protein TadB